MDKIGICIAYKINGEETEIAPLGADQYEACEAVIEEMPGWSETTVGITDYDKLPENAKAYIQRIEQILDVKITILSTGPNRHETIILESPFA